MLLSIITINYKTPDLTIACIDSVYKNLKDMCDKNEIEHIIIDNNSADKSIEKITLKIKKLKYKHVKLITNLENSGFGKGCNLAEKRAKGKYVLFLNSDTIVEDNKFLEMTKFLDENQKIAILGTRIFSFNKIIQPSSFKFYTLFNFLLLLLGLERFGFLQIKSDNPIKTDWVSGGCMMVRKVIFDKVKGFDENIFMYTEDMELCFRVRKLGFLTYLFPFATVLHKSQGSSSRSFAIFNICKNIIYFYKKHMPLWQLPIVKFLIKAKAFTLVSFGKIIRNSYLVLTYEKVLSIS